MKLYVSFSGSRDGKLNIGAATIKANQAPMGEIDLETIEGWLMSEIDLSDVTILSWQVLPDNWED